MAPQAATDVLDVVQLIPYAEYAASKQAGTLQALMDSTWQSSSLSELRQAKRPLAAVATSSLPAVTAQAIQEKRQRRTKKLKRMVPGCRTM